MKIGVSEQALSKWGNGARELEVFDTFEHKAGYAYMPVMLQ